MTSQDERFIQIVTEYSKDVRDFAEASLAHVAGRVKRHMPQSWLPEQARPLPPPAPPAIGRSLVYRLQDWVLRNRTLTAAVFAFLSTGGLLLWREKKQYNRRRRARRASNGAKSEVVVIAGSFDSPVTRSLSFDLDRRGFIVYVVCSSLDEEQQVLSESRTDIRPLHLDVADSLATHDAIAELQSLLTRSHLSATGARPHHLALRGVIIIPDMIYPTGPIETTSIELWSDVLHTKLLNSVAMTQALLPIITQFHSRVLMLTPSIIASLRPPFHSVETTVVGALQGFLTTLRAELDTLGIYVIQFHLGSFDVADVGAKNQLRTRSSGSMSPAVWPRTTRALYADNFVSHSRAAQHRGLLRQGGSPLRELHNATFDALNEKKPRRVWRVGRGSVMYDIVGTWIPSSLVGWMMGLRRVWVDGGSRPQWDEGVQSWEKIDAA